MDHSRSYSEELYKESTVYEDHAVLLCNLADALIEAAGRLQSFAQDNQQQAFLTRRQSYESQSLSFDSKPQPTPEQYASLDQRVQEISAKAEVSDHCAEGIQKTMLKLISNLKDAEPSMSKDEAQVTTKAPKRAVCLQRYLVEEAEKSQIEKEEPVDTNSERSQAGADTSTVADSDHSYLSDSCSPLPCQGDLHVSTCFKLVFGTLETGHVTTIDHQTRKRSAQDAFPDEDSTLVDTTSSESSNSELPTSASSPKAQNPRDPTSHNYLPKVASELYLAEIKASVASVHLSHPLLEWIPQKIPISPATVLGTTDFLESHPYGF